MFLQSSKTKYRKHSNPSAILCRRVLLLLFVLLTRRLNAQYFISSNDDSEIDWRQIKTERFQLVYPDFYEADAQRLALVLDTVSRRVGTTLGTPAPFIPILIHTNGSKSNGLLVWAPKRMEFWTTPPPTHYAYPWSWQLAVHEYRHACQMQALDKGISGVLNTIFGEHILGAVSGLLVPMWFLEGDAVVAETSMTPTGRGQTPEFKMQYKAMLLEKGIYGIDKMKLGSLKDYVPNEYVHGYYMSAFSRHLYGADVFSQVLESTTKDWWKGSWFTRTKNGRFSEGEIYARLSDSLLSVWQKEKQEWEKCATKSPIQELQEPKRRYTHYKNPVQTAPDSVLALKTSFFDVQSLVLITNGETQHIRKLPYLKHSHFDYSQGKILYAQDAINHRWGQQTNCQIIEYDLRNKMYRVLTKDGIFFNPIYTPKDETLIAAIETDHADNQSLVVLTPNAKFLKTTNPLAKNESLYIKTISPKDKSAFSFPCWSEDGRELYVIETSSYGKCIAKYNIQSGEREQITPNSFDDISRLSAKNGRLYFLKDLKSKYEIVSIDLQTGKQEQQTASEYGVGSYWVCQNKESENPKAVSENQKAVSVGQNAVLENGNADLILSLYNSEGYRITKSRELGLLTDLTEENPPQIFVEQLRKEENFMLTSQAVPQKDSLYPSSSYSKAAHLFNFHSWSPFYLNVEKIDLGIGVSFFSQNLLSTSVLQFGYKYNPSDVKHELYLDYTYSGLYPVIDVESSYKMRSVQGIINDTSYLSQWDEFSNSIALTFPYRWNTQRTLNTINASINYSVRKLISPKSTLDEWKRQVVDLFGTFGAGFNLSALTAQAQNDLTPRLGEVIRLNYKYGFAEPSPYIFSLVSSTYLPFFGKNQSLQLTLSYQKNTPEIYYFPNEVEFTKGVYFEFPKEYGGVSLMLHTPIAYPDWRLGAVVYCKRISASPFFEAGRFDGDWQMSFGSDINFNLHLLRITTPLNLGVRLGYLPQAKSGFFNFLFGIDL